MANDDGNNPKRSTNGPCAISLLLLLLSLTACVSPAPDARSADDLVDRFRTTAVKEAAPGESGWFDRHTWVTRGGRRLDAITLIAPIAVRASLAGFSGRFMLKMWAAPVFNTGDGMRMKVLAGKAGEAREIFSRYFDAGRNASDRRWTELEVPLDLDLDGSSDADVEIQVSAGAQGDLATDWLALARIQLAKIQK